MKCLIHNFVVMAEIDAGHCLGKGTPNLLYYAAFNVHNFTQHRERGNTWIVTQALNEDIQCDIKYT